MSRSCHQITVDVRILTLTTPDNIRSVTPKLHSGDHVAQSDDVSQPENDCQGTQPDADNQDPLA
jgi:hypothetical protein